VPLSIAAVLVVSATLTLLVAERREHVPSAGLDAAPASPPTAQAPPAEAQRLAEPRAPAKEVAPRAAAPRPQGQSAAEPAQPTDESRRELYDAATEAKGVAAPPPAAPATPSMQSAPAPGAAAEPAQTAGATSSRADEEPTVPPAVPSREVSVRERDSGVSKKGQTPQAFPEREQARAEARAKSSNDVDAEAGKRELPTATQRVAEPPPDPKTWIERIQALRREGKLEEAGRSLQEFRRRYPDYPLPPELAGISSEAAPR
jgi:hypothetical protein